MIIDPWGQVLNSTHADDEALVMATIDRARQAQFERNCRRLRIDDCASSFKNVASVKSK